MASFVVALVLTGADEAFLNWAFITYHCTGYALVPATVIIALSEVHSLRSPIYLAGIGTAATIIAWWLFEYRNVLDGNAPLREEIRLAVGFAIYGLVAGLVYWLLAGRTAGSSPGGAGGSSAVA